MEVSLLPLLAVTAKEPRPAEPPSPLMSQAYRLGQTTIECKVRVNTGNGVLTELPSIGTVITVHGMTPTPTPTSTPISPTLPPVTITPTSPVDAWLTFTNMTYGFQFKYPPQGQIVDGGNDNFTRINLPFVQGTNLTEKYLEVIVAENADPCQSPLATQSMVETSETVIFHGITFLNKPGRMEPPGISTNGRPTQPSAIMSVSAWTLLFVRQIPVYIPRHRRSMMKRLSRLFLSRWHQPMFG